MKALEAIRVRSHLTGQQLEGYLAPELGVSGEIDLAHPALAKLADDLEMRELPADQDPAILARRNGRLVVHCSSS